jgi:hypothetical protein
VLCEGLSESTYMLSLNKLLDSKENNNFKLTPKILKGNGNIPRQLKKIRAENRNTKYAVWID